MQKHLINHLKSARRYICCLYIFGLLIGVCGVPAIGQQLSPSGSRIRHSHKVKLTLEFDVQRDENGQPLMDTDGEPVVGYIPANAHLDKNGNYDLRADVLIRSIPPTPHYYFGRLLSLSDDVQIITSDRIITNTKGVFHATLRTRNGKATWNVRMHRIDDL
jgi:hypothetical protein